MATGTRPSTRPQPQPFQHDGSVDSQVRNKENVRSPSSPKANVYRRGRTFIPSLVQSTEKVDFFTDSYLADNNASQTSLIPSPLPQPIALSRPRRKVRPVKPAEFQHPRPGHRSTRSEVPALTQQHFQSTPQKPLARGTSPIRSTGLSTPPRSRDGSFNESPIEAQFSSPPRALTETYERIDQEEDLAATEGEISDPDSELPQQNDVNIPLDVDQAKNMPVNFPKPLARSSGSTPTNARFSDVGQRAPKDDYTVASVLSDPTGMSFVDQLSDPNLRLAMTPHMVQSAADRDALRKIWDSKRPIAFGKANKVHLDAQEVAPSMKDSPPGPPQRLIAFSKAGRRRLASDLAAHPSHQRTFSDVTDRIEHASQEDRLPKHNDNWHNENLKREALPHNPRIHRDPYFPRTHGFPERQASTQLNGVARPHPDTGKESPLPASGQPVQPQPGRESFDRPPNGLISTNIYPIRNLGVNQSEPNLTLERQSSVDNTSNVDWMEAAANEPVQSIEIDYPQRNQRRLSDIRDVDLSPEKSRKLDIDFTGQSFQVSESPPVRARSSTSDTSRAREIRGLAKRAVTTSRLSQLRARESLERLRQNSKSPVSELTADSLRELAAEGERLGDSPIVVYRSNSINSGKKSSETPPARPTPDRSQSHDLLQRLARGSSSTPRSTTPSDYSAKGLIGNDKYDQDGEGEAIMRDVHDEDDSTLQRPTDPSGNSVKATPRVVGAWTDTVLPDTIKTVKQTGQRMRYAQTPQVSAGGWIDTPAPANPSSRLEPLLESTQEVPEELMTGIAQAGLSGQKGKAAVIEVNHEPSSHIPLQINESLAKRVLAEAKDKLEAQNEARPVPNADDSFVLGNATIQSLENILDMDETDMTILSRIGEEPLGQTDTEVLDRLGSKLDRLRTHIHDARQGISKLESQISRPEVPVQTAAVAVSPPVLCEVCNRPQTASQQHTHREKSSTYFPLTLLTMTVPIPLLFNLQPSAPRWRLPRPTPVGWVVIAIWVWYLLECTFAELYSHPQYASHYVWPDQQEPDFPFVLPTILWRWSHLSWTYPYLVQPVLKIAIGSIRMLGMWFGLTDGFTDGPADTILENVVETVYQQTTTSTGTALYMMNDELL